MSIADARPDLIPTWELFVEAHKRLFDAYEDYVAHVSPPQMAMSYQSACYIYGLCHLTNPQRVVDYGSGFTSYVLREYAADSGATVHSLDNSPEWLKWTDRFLTRRGFVARDSLHLWPDIPDGTWDLAVYDFGSGAFRNEHMRAPVDRCADSGIVIFDDAQHHAHRAFMEDACRSRRFDLFSLIDQTSDDYGRYAALAVHTAAST